MMNSDDSSTPLINPLIPPIVATKPTSPTLTPTSPPPSNLTHHNNNNNHNSDQRHHQCSKFFPSTTFIIAQQAMAEDTLISTSTVISPNMNNKDDDSQFHSTTKSMFTPTTTTATTAFHKNHHSSPSKKRPFSQFEKQQQNEEIMCLDYAYDPTTITTTTTTTNEQIFAISPSSSLASSSPFSHHLHHEYGHSSEEDDDDDGYLSDDVTTTPPPKQKQKSFHHHDNELLKTTSSPSTPISTKNNLFGKTMMNSIVSSTPDQSPAYNTQQQQQIEKEQQASQSIVKNECYVSSGKTLSSYVDDNDENDVIEVIELDDDSDVDDDMNNKSNNSNEIDMLVPIDDNDDESAETDHHYYHSDSSSDHVKMNDNVDNDESTSLLGASSSHPSQKNNDNNNHQNYYRQLCYEYKNMVEELIQYMNVSTDMFYEYQKKCNALAAKIENIEEHRETSWTLSNHHHTHDHSHLINEKSGANHDENDKSSCCGDDCGGGSDTIGTNEMIGDDVDDDSNDNNSVSSQIRMFKPVPVMTQRIATSTPPTPTFAPESRTFNHGANNNNSNSNSNTYYPKHNGNIFDTPIIRSDIVSANSLADQIDIKGILNNVFRLSEFRPNQEQIIRSSLNSEDIVVVQATGSGKSLCYQLPAVCVQKLTIVISPLIALIHDQVSYLKSLGIKATYLSSTHNKLQTIDKMLMNHYRIIYVTPERIVENEKFTAVLKQLYRKDLLHRIVIDEAHCISKWGHDFRYDYRRLHIVRQNFPTVPIMALTATASPEVKTDIIHSLNINPRKFESSFNRKNLFYEIRYKGTFNEMIRDISAFITEKHANSCGIIYCHSKKESAKISEELNALKHSTAVYHADIGANKKVEHHDMWKSGDIKIMVATVAFGMGIDKPDVRFIIHASMAKSIEDYYQATGRAGRDGKPSDCVLYFSNGDRTRNVKMLQQTLQSEQNHQVRKNAERSLNRMVQYCETTGCRRKFLLTYFGEKCTERDCANTCDNCRRNTIPVEEVNITEDALDLLKIIMQTKQRCSLSRCVNIWRGSMKKILVDAGYNEMQGHGTGKHLSIDEANRISNRLLQENFVVEKAKPGYGSFGVSVAMLTTKGESFLASGVDHNNNLVMSVRQPKQKKKPTRTSTSSVSKKKNKVRSNESSEPEYSSEEESEDEENEEGEEDDEHEYMDDLDDDFELPDIISDNVEEFSTHRNALMDDLLFSQPPTQPAPSTIFMSRQKKPRSSRTVQQPRRQPIISRLQPQPQPRIVYMPVRKNEDSSE